MSAGQGGHLQHEHHHAAGASARRLTFALVLTSIVLVAEVITAALTGSLALLADAGHMATDTVGLVVALAATRLSQRRATDRSTWGLRRAEVLGAAMQAAMLAVIGAFVGARALADLMDPPEVASTGMLIMGAIGLAANAIALVILTGGRHSSLTMRAAFLEVANDALGSAGVLVAAAVIWRTGWQRADAVASLIIVALIVPRALSLLRATGKVLMEFTPDELDLEQVRAHLTDLDDVEAVHDLHVWTVASGLPVLTAHIVVSQDSLASGRTETVLDALQACVASHFPVRIEHSTFQLEPAAHLAHETGACH